MDTIGEIFATLFREIEEGANKLHRIEPNHPLLRHMDPVFTGQWTNDQIREFYGEFNPTGRLGAMTTRRSYCTAIQAALKAE